MRQDMLSQAKSIDLETVDHKAVARTVVLEYMQFSNTLEKAALVDYEVGCLWLESIQKGLTNNGATFALDQISLRILGHIAETEESCNLTRHWRGSEARLASCHQVRHNWHRLMNASFSLAGVPVEAVFSAFGEMSVSPTHNTLMVNTRRSY